MLPFWKANRRPESPQSAMLQHDGGDSDGKSYFEAQGRAKEEMQSKISWITQSTN